VNFGGRHDFFDDLIQEEMAYKLITFGINNLMFLKVLEQGGKM
jgi:hypothetical protein